MEFYETIIVGGGPAGSSCAWKLKRDGREVAILDKEPFPRTKLCAGWITSKVMENLDFTVQEYPHSILKIKTKIYIAPFPFSLGSWPTRWTDYSIRRIEFDQWMLDRARVEVITHQVKKIEQENGYYIIDGQYKCKYLVGAGGTGCPVRRTLFSSDRCQRRKILTLEKEFKYPQRDDTAHFFFFFQGLKGYYWYVPKGDGFVNIGLGGLSSFFKRSRTNIHLYLHWFLQDLVKRGLLDDTTASQLQLSGYSYYLFSKEGEIKKNNCFSIGDSAGLATVDLGEGINPAIESGLQVADEIMGYGQYTKSAIDHFSLNRLLQWTVEPLLLKAIGI